MRRALHAGPWLRLARTQWAPLAALAVLTLLTAVLAVAVPAATAAGYDRDAAATVGTDSDLKVVGRAKGGGAVSAVPNEGALTANAFTWQQLLPGVLRNVTGPPEPSVTTSGTMGVAGEFPEPRNMNFDWEPGAEQRVGIVSGRPAMNRPSLNPGSAGQEIQVMVAERFATAMGYKAGTRLTLTEDGVPSPPVHVRITGLYAPLNPRDAYWRSRVTLLQSTERVIDREGTKAAFGTALTDNGGYTMLAGDASRSFTFTWRFPVRTGSVDTGRARTIAGDLDSYRTAVQGHAGLFACTVDTPLTGQLDAFLGRLRTAQSVLGMALAGLLAVAAGVLLLACGLLAERLRPFLGTMRARGASLRQLAGYVGGLTALAVVPAAAAGCGAGLLLDTGPPQRTSFIALAALILLLLALSGAAVLRERGGGLGSAGGARADLTAARPSARRLVLDVLLVVVAVAGVLVLRQRGQASGDDPLVAAVPVLLGAALGMLVLRGYPYLLRAAGPLLRRGCGAVWFVGLARASRQSVIGALPLVILLLAAAVAGFSATVDAALRHGQVRASYSVVGGDVRIASTGLDPSVVAKARAVKGVTAVVPARAVQQVTGPGEPAPIVAVGIDLDAYRKAFPGVPDVPDAANGQLVSPGAAGILESGDKTVTLSSHFVDPFPFRPTGKTDRFPGVDPGAAFVVVPYKTFGSSNFPTELFVRGDHIDVAALRKVLDEAAPKGAARDVQIRRDVLHGMTEVPMVHLVHRTFRNAALIGGVFGLLAVLLVLVVGARARGRTVAHLRVLGLHRRQSRVLALVEITPVLLCAVAAGWVLGLLLPEITGPVVDLRSYTSGFTATGHTPGLAAVLGLLAALLLAGAAALAVDRAFDRPDLGDVLRTGD